MGVMIDCRAWRSEGCRNVCLKYPGHDVGVCVVTCWQPHIARGAMNGVECPPESTRCAEDHQGTTQMWLSLSFRFCSFAIWTSSRAYTLTLDAFSGGVHHRRRRLLPMIWAATRVHLRGSWSNGEIETYSVTTLCTIMDGRTCSLDMSDCGELTNARPSPSVSDERVPAESSLSAGRRSYIPSSPGCGAIRSCGLEQCGNIEIEVSILGNENMRKRKLLHGTKMLLFNHMNTIISKYLQRQLTSSK